MQMNNQDWENARIQARAVCKSAVPKIFRQEIFSDSAKRNVIQTGILDRLQEEELVNLIASNLIAAYDNGYEAGRTFEAEERNETN
jgi:hypothetical protein